MTNPDGVGHDPMKDMLLHFSCEQWARKLAASRVDLFSAAESAAFETHKENCSRCQAVVQQYRMVDATLYDLLFDGYIALPVYKPALPWWLRVRHYLREAWSLVRRSSIHILYGVAFVLQAGGIALLALLLFLVVCQSYFQVLLRIPISPIVLFALAITCILLGQQGLRESFKFSHSGGAGSQPALRIVRPRWSQSGNRTSSTSITWNDSVLLPSLEGEERERRALRASPLLPSPRLRTLREKWVVGITLSLLIAICVASLGWLPRFASPSDTDSRETAPTGAPVGISVNGSTVFDTDRMDGDLKRQAASMVTANNMEGAKVLWNKALVLDSNDAEVLIYKENQRVLESFHPYFTLVVGIIFSQQHIGGARDILQGAYVAQKEYNDAMIGQPHSTLLRLMIAASDVDTLSPQTTAQEVVQAAQKDHSIVGVIGWSTSTSTDYALPIFNAAHLPMISATASGDELSGKSPYFFRVAPTDAQQALVAARYVTETLHAQRIALFTDPQDGYSNSLATAFKSSLLHDDPRVVTSAYTYVKGDPSTIDIQMLHVLQLQPDLIYFAGYVSDASTVLKHLTVCKNRSNCLLVMGGDGLYVQGDYSTEDLKNYDRLIFTAFAFQAQEQLQHPQFFKDYALYYDPNNLYRPGTYGYTSSDADAILSYDATHVFLQASQQILAHPQSKLTPQAIQQTLCHIQVAGVSGQISFDQNGNPVNKGIVILKGSENGKTLFVQSGS